MESLKQVWGAVCEDISNKISTVAFKSWIECIQPVTLEDGRAVLCVKTSFQKNIIEKNYAALLESAFEQVLGFPIAASIVSADEEKTAPPEAPGWGVSDEYEYTFDSFIVGPSNKFAHAAAFSVAANPGKAFNPLFIYGDSGLGKTHLLNAICHQIKTDHPSTNIIYIKGDEFTNELVESLRTHTQIAFRQKYRNADVLVIDDIQFIAGKDVTQLEFFHTFDALHRAGRQIILSSDRPPKDIKTLEERLRSRFESGLADIQTPDFETRVAIIQKKAELHQLKLSDEIIDFIADKVRSNIRQIDGVVKRIKAYQMLNDEQPSLMTASNATRDILSDHQATPVSLETIITEVANTYNVSEEDILSKKRTAVISDARQICIYVTRQLTDLSLEQIGKSYGGRHHSTMLYTIDQVENEMKKSESLRETVEDIIKNLKNR